MADNVNIEIDRDQQILNRLAQIQHRVDSIEQTNAFALRAEAEKYEAVLKDIFGDSKRRAQVYLAANGARGVQEIAEHLNMQRQNVGRDLKYLSNHGMLEIIDVQSGKDIWAKKPLDRSLQITRLLQKWFPLDSDGRPINRKTPRKRNLK